jgi:hypothetical protein
MEGDVSWIRRVAPEANDNQESGGIVLVASFESCLSL